MNLDQQLSDWLAPLVRGASQSARRDFSRAARRYLWKSQSDRIRQQLNPDGTPYQRRKSGEKQRMFDKIRRKPNLKARNSDAGVEVGFFGRVAAVADEHQHGKVGQVRAGVRTRYARRELLGFTERDISTLQALAFEHLTGGM